MFSKIKKITKDVFIFIVFILIFDIIRTGLEKYLFFIPKEWNSASIESEFISTKLAISSLLSLTILGYLYYRYEKLKDDLHLWKNKEKIINPFNKHYYDKD
jgi:hypothetical protein